MHCYLPKCSTVVAAASISVLALFDVSLRAADEVPIVVPDSTTRQGTTPAGETPRLHSALNIDSAATSSDGVRPPTFVVRIDTPTRPRRPASLLPLYVAYGFLQAADTSLTLSAIGRGAREANPLMAGLVHQPVAFTALKSGAGLLSVLVAEHLWKSGHRKTAVIMMAVASGLTAAAVAQNVRVIREVQR